MNADGSTQADTSTPPAGTSRAGLIHSIYRIALEPQSYDVFMDHWNDHVSRALAELKNLQDQAAFDDPAILSHFETAFGILVELGRRPHTPLRDGHGPRLLLDGTGQVVWCNAAAVAAFALPPQPDITAIMPAVQNPTALERMLIAIAPARADASHPATGEVEACLLRLATTAGESFMLARAIRERGGQQLLLIEPLMGEWTPEMDRLLGNAFGLTAAETAIAAGLAEGHNATALAERRGVSVLTVRAQIRALLAKTGAASQTELVRLLISAARAVERSEQGAERPQAPQILPLPGRRELHINTMGPRGGVPVVFFHGMLDGCSATPRIEAALERAGLRLLAPIRPGFGSAPARRLHPADAATSFAGDICQMLDRLGIERAVLLGHMAGTLYAFAAAARLRERALGIVNVAGTVPIVSVAQLASMSRRQRLVAYTARFAPAALPFVLRAGIRQLDFDGEHSFMSALYENSPRDLELCADTDVFRSIRRGYRFTVEQGHHAFETDGYLVVRDWSTLAEASQVPVSLLHGRHDPVVSADSVSAFALRLGKRARLRLFDDCGQLVLYRHPERVFETVREHASAALHSVPAG
ncbi:MAG: alpha/beta fold hydrolase [Pararhodobacter sp.]|nr:alpha/beta fold hydrolase [Pararhodobacter sp.]